MKYDDASWHYGGDFPSDLPQSAGATHIANFVAWSVLNGLGGDYQLTECADELEKLRLRAITPTEWFLAVSDEKFTDEDLRTKGIPSHWHTTAGETVFIRQSDHT